jgi:hypothetical protein
VLRVRLGRLVCTSGGFVELCTGQGEVERGQSALEAVVPFPEFSNWLLAPVEASCKLHRMMAFASNLICPCWAGFHGFIALPAASPAPRQVPASKSVNSF